jgi:hypothetical protein
MTSATYEDYVRILNDAFEAAQNDNTLLYEAAKEELRALPGFPNNIHPDLDVVVPVIDDTTTRITTFGSTVH